LNDPAGRDKRLYDLEKADGVVQDDGPAQSRESGTGTKTNRLTIGMTVFLGPTAKVQLSIELRLSNG
jgi:hypothetical protein